MQDDMDVNNYFYQNIPKKIEFDRIILHIDFDYFFAQCEELRNSEIKQYPVLVCVFSGRTSESGVVSTCNYVARKYGVRSGMPINVAKSKLAKIHSVILPLDLPYYRKISDKTMKIISKYSNKMEVIGIDECYLDITGKTGLDFKTANETAIKIKEDIMSSIGISCSVGVSYNKIFSKIASDYSKPNGLFLIYPDMINQFLSTLAIEKIPGIGPKNKRNLEKIGITNGLELINLDIDTLVHNIGNKKLAIKLHNMIIIAACESGIENQP